MLRHSMPVAVCGRQAYRKLLWRQVAGVVCKQQKINYMSFKSRKSAPVIPECNWSTLDSGLRVITEQTCSPLACVTVLADAGSRFETLKNNGICHFFEHMVCRGLISLNGHAFEEYIKDIGAHLSIHTDREYQAFVFTCPPTEVENIITLIPRMFCELECDIVDVQRALMDVKNQSMELEYDSKQLCFDHLHQTAFQGTPMAMSPLGSSWNYSGFGKCYLQAFIIQHYQPCRLVISVSSIYCHEDVKCCVQAAFSNYKQTCYDCPYWPCRYTGSIIRFRDDSMPFCHVALAVETKGYYSSDYITLQLMKHIIGHWNESQTQGYNTWPLLAHACAIAKLCHSYEAFYLPYRDIGLWGVYFVIKKEDDYDDAILMIQDQWMNLCNTTSYAEVNRAAAALKFELAKAVDGCVASCFDMGLQMLFSGFRNNVIDHYSIIDCLTNKEVRNLADSIIYDRCPVISAIGPTEAIPDYNRIRGGMYWLRN